MNFGLHHSYSVALAIELKDRDKAIIIHHFQYWINLNKRKKSPKNFRENRYWTFQTIDDIHAALPEFTKDSLIHHLNVLVEKKILLKGNFNKSRIDKTCWYAFQDEEKFLDKEESNYVYERGKPLSTGENPHPVGENPKAIPDPIPDTVTTYTKREEAAPPSPLVYKYFNKVKMEEKKYKELVKEFGEKTVKDKIDRLNAYSDENPKRFKTYGCHAAIVHRWIDEDKSKVIDNEIKIDEQEHRKIAVEIVHNFPVEVKKNHIQVQELGVVFCIGKEFELIHFKDIEFRDKVACQLTKITTVLEKHENKPQKNNAQNK
jgi:hypothetical protein